MFQHRYNHVAFYHLSAFFLMSADAFVCLVVGRSKHRRLQRKTCFSWRLGVRLIEHTMTNLSMDKVGLDTVKMPFAMNRWTQGKRHVWFLHIASTLLLITRTRTWPFIHYNHTSVVVRITAWGIWQSFNIVSQIHLSPTKDKFKCLKETTIAYCPKLFYHRQILQCVSYGRS